MATWPHNGILNIDHPVIASADLDAARAAFERLGFTVPPRGSHIEWGTGNLCIMFAEDYVEVRGIIDPDRFTMHLDTHLEQHGEGLMGVAFGTDAVGRSIEEARRNGIDTGELRRLRRNFEHPEGWTQPAFELFSPQANDIEGLMHVVVIQHLTPELIRRPDFLEHANGCIGINGIAGKVTDVAGSATKMRRLLGEPAVLETHDALTLTVPSGQWIRLEQAKQAGLDSITLRVSDRQKLCDLLDAAGVAFTSGIDGVVSVGAGYACGCALMFTDQAPG